MLGGEGPVCFVLSGQRISANQEIDFFLDILIIKGEKNVSSLSESESYSV